MLRASQQVRKVSTGRRRFRLTYVLGCEEEPLPVKPHVFRLFWGAIVPLLLLLLLRRVHHARHLNVAFPFAKPHGGGVRVGEM